MGIRRYTVPYQGTLTNAGADADLFELTPADDKPIYLRRILLAQLSEVGDTAEEGVRVSVIYLPATVTSGNGSAVTPVPLDPLGIAAGFAAEANGATVATTSGTAAIIYEFAWNIRIAPTEIMFGPDLDDMPCARQGGAIVVRCQTTVADDVSIAITAEVLES